MGKRIFLNLFLMLFCSTGIFAQTGGNTLIVYYPVTRSNSLTGDVDTVTYASGNMHKMVSIIHDMTGADLFEIDLVSPYSSRYNMVLREAKDDQKRRARPEIRNRVSRMEQYDTILLGYPNWWATIPMPIASFLESYDLSGKTIIPFCTHGGGRLGQSVSAIAKITPTSRIMKPLEIHYGGGRTLGEEIEEWLKDNGVSLK